MTDAPLPGMEAAVRDLESARRRRIREAETDLDEALSNELFTGVGRISNRRLHRLRKAIDKVLEARQR